MAEPTPPPATEAAGAAAATAPAAPKPAATTAPAAAPYKAPQPSPLRMMGIPGLPKKLPSRNWMIFWTVLGSFSAAVIYDKREKKRATAKWARTVAHLAKEPVGNAQQLPRKLTVYLESPPGDGLLPSQEHYIEYIKPVLAASGLDWEFVQGRKEGDIRAAVAERIRRARDTDGSTRAEGQELTKDEIIKAMREKSGVPEFHGPKGDIVVGRHTWKEYMRGLHEGWLGPLTAPVTETPPPAADTKAPSAAASTSADSSKGVSAPEVVNIDEIKHDEDASSAKKAAAEAAEKEKKEAEEAAAKKSERPPQPVPYNKTTDYPSSPLPLLIPAEFSPSAPIPCPHVLGFSSTPVRLWRFLNRRKLADDVGREVAAVCLAAAREWREDDVSAQDPNSSTPTPEREERGVYNGANSAEGQEKIWTQPVVTDPRITMRMRRFELLPEDEERSRAVVVPEVEIEGWIKGSLRELWQWIRAPAEPNPRWSTDSDFS
ncbi:mitochondrial import inner membrane translocase subunit Tim54 [Microdochium trichocladiopsis]|uniref:Mitochondrial import inner membrane translocase subunit TIM54 n=1 Tax=Microdochium trichocladiopsis TaxID=1682393 RepID=A0A9P8YGQ5_9PEZI|nr:mitochondrial import inner membrane translocase subunit Tim54 [Microdochium trichocladiopsis]KAH7039668.1 mitochondrial import inner membrane translocase subunit Tim54 [Microdochium trichocladiopsis]